MTVDEVAEVCREHNLPTSYVKTFVDLIDRNGDGELQIHELQEFFAQGEQYRTNTEHDMMLQLMCNTARVRGAEVRECLSLLANLRNRRGPFPLGQRSSDCQHVVPHDCTHIDAKGAARRSGRVCHRRSGRGAAAVPADARP